MPEFGSAAAEHKRRRRNPKGHGGGILSATAAESYRRRRRNPIGRKREACDKRERKCGSWALQNNTAHPKIGIQRKYKGGESGARIPKQFPTAKIDPAQNVRSVR
jgi:hypothetical protein